MKILLINVTYGTGSTGKICEEIVDNFVNEGHEVRIAYGRDCAVSDQKLKYAIRIGNNVGVKLHALKTRIFDKHGLGSTIATKKFLKWADEYNPDLLWLHNIHGYYINYELLFEWIKKRPQMEVKWTLHDCWSFTGHCGYFTMVNCDKWKNKCNNCIQKRRYPKSFILDNSENNFERKKRAFTCVDNLSIIVPSQWLANLVKISFLGKYPISVISNKINTDVFKPTQSDFRKMHHLENKKIVLGVANVWEEHKGLKDFIALSHMLDSRYQIVLVGLNNSQIRSLPSNMIGMGRTATSEELAGMYTTADVYVNPSREETFGMTVIEALACGTDVIVYSQTACEEVARNNGGIVVGYGDVVAMCEEIRKICEHSNIV